jgi:unsaturated rhamnogalacturonyl hydrolase
LHLNNVKTVEKIHSVESILPFAILAQINPKHPLLKTAIEFCEAHANAEGVVADGTGNNRMIKTEECYTVSYPLAVLAKTLIRPDLEKLAIKTLQSRVSMLEKSNSIYQRGTEQGELFFENWSRGVAWYLLGLAKTLVHLPESAEKESLKKSFQNSVEKIISYQQTNGLWYNFFHQPQTGFETSGTAGIAAALTFGFEHNLLNENAQNAAIRAKIGLMPYLTSDGFLTGTAQVNKGGDSLQQNGFRVISPYTLGFFAHLIIK